METIKIQSKDYKSFCIKKKIIKYCSTSWWNKNPHRRGHNKEIFMLNVETFKKVYLSCKLKYFYNIHV